MVTLVVKCSGHCIWYDECFQDKHYNCQYEGPARPLTNQSAVKILEAYCPTLVSADKSMIHHHLSLRM